MVALSRARVIVVSLLTLATTARGGVLLSQNFNDITSLAGNGWVLTNNSSPVGLTGWFQGNTTVFAAQAGPANSYIAANFDNAAFGGNISNWLLTPVLLLDSTTVFSFYTSTETNPAAADDLQILMSTNGASTNVGSTATSVGDFTTLLLDVNPTLNPNGYPTPWTQYTVSLSGLGVPVFGRLAFRYVVPDTSTNADYIGIDTVLGTSSLPEPSTIVLALSGLAGICSLRRLKSRTKAKVLSTSLLACCVVATSHAQTAAKPAPEQTAPVPVSAGGLLIFIDPVTHQIRQPDASEIGALVHNSAADSKAKPLNRIAEPITIQGPGNAVGVKLDESSMVFMVVTKTPDGKLKQDCVTGEKAATARVEGAQSPAKKETLDVK